MRHRFVDAATILVASPALARSNLTILPFGFDSARLIAEHEPLIDASVTEFRTSESSNVSIVGHADSTGSPDHSFALSG